MRAVLWPDMIEIENDGIPLAAVHAARLVEDPSDVFGVAPPSRPRWPRRWPPRRRPPSMATHADDLAEKDLLIKSLGRGAFVRESCEAAPLALDVVELENHWVGLAAVGAWVRREVLEDMVFCAEAALRKGRARLCPVKIAPLPEVLPEAAAAAVLPAAECTERERDRAAAAASQSREVGDW
jgi:hypothetical protein